MIDTPGGAGGIPVVLRSVLFVRTHDLLKMQDRGFGAAFAALAVAQNPNYTMVILA